MFMAALFVTMDLEPEVPSADREKVLRALRDKLRSVYSHRIVVRSDEDTTLFVSLFDENFERSKTRIGEVLEKIEGASEARVSDSSIQVFEWFEGAFVETIDELDDQDNGNARRREKEADKMIVYGREDEDDFTAIPTGLNRRTMRLPTRK